MLAPRRSRHPLHTAFRTMDATDYTEISTVDAEGRALLDLALDPAAGLLALVTVDAAEGQASSARIYEIGRSRTRVSGGEGLCWLRGLGLGPPPRASLSSGAAARGCAGDFGL